MTLIDYETQRVYNLPVGAKLHDRRYILITLVREDVEALLDHTDYLYAMLAGFRLDKEVLNDPTR